MYQDLLVWNLFLDKCNGVSYMLDIDWSSSSALELFTDSAGGSTKGCVVIFKENCSSENGPRNGPVQLLF